MSRVFGVCVSALALLTVAGAAHAQVADRYGPATSYAPDATSAQAGPVAVLAGAPVRMLSWPGKVAPSAGMATQDAPSPDLRPAFTPVRAAPTPRSRNVQIASAAVASSRPDYSATRYAPAVADAPEPSATGPHYGLVQAVPRQPIENAPSIYDAPAAPRPSARRAPPRAAAPAPEVQAAQTHTVQTHAAQPQAAPTQTPPAQTASAQPAAADAAHPGWAPPRHAWSQAGDNGVRFYSLHRQYGMAPDPAPIPPQFFAATADLGEPAGPMTRTISGAGSTAQAARAVQAAQSDTASDPASSQP